MNILPREVSEIVNEYKEGSFRVKGKVNLLTEIKQLKPVAIPGEHGWELQFVKGTESIPLNLHEGVWSAIVSPFTYDYVHYDTLYRVDVVSLAKYYSLIFYLEGSDLNNLPRNIIISSKEMRNKRLKSIALCSESKTLYNLNADGVLFELGRYSHTDYIVIMVAQVTETISSVNREILEDIEEQRGKDFDRMAEELLPGIDTDKHRIEKKIDEKFLQKLGLQRDDFHMFERGVNSLYLDIRLDDAPNINDGYGHIVQIDLRGTFLEPLIEIIDAQTGTLKHYLEDKNNRRKYEAKVKRKTGKETKTEEGVLQSGVELL